MSYQATKSNQGVHTLATQISTAVRPWAKSKRRPSFTTEELVVMALAWTDAPMTKLDIANWIMDRFPYYVQLARREFLKPTHHQPNHGRQVSCSRSTKSGCCCPHRIREVMSQFEVPVGRIEMEGGKGDNDDEKALWITSGSEARIFLQAAMRDKDATRHFPFTRLPAELRVRIYELVLGFPCTGIRVDIERPRFGSVRSQLYVTSRSYEANTDEGSEHKPHDLKCRSSAKILALLQANKQIYQEALPVFYSINTFDIASTTHLSRFLAIMPPSCLKHLGHIRFTYLPSDAPGAASAFRRLKTIEHLRELDIDIDEAAWLDHTAPRKRMQVYPDLKKLPGFATLRSIRGLKRVSFHGDCENVKAYLGPEMTKPKPASKGTAKRAKRKDREE
ncbi:hypothetical protein LTR08_003341 [Meristemomyces frigidus]|nr:hypothetical protein LTR08_003341 [Meristemomyces frigidus]